eukprot:gene24831-30005_t
MDREIQRVHTDNNTLLREFNGIAIYVWHDTHGILIATGVHDRVGVIKVPDQRGHYIIRAYMHGFALESVAYPGYFLSLGSEGAMVRTHVRGDEMFVLQKLPNGKIALKCFDFNRHLHIGQGTVFQRSIVHEDGMLNMSVAEVPTLVSMTVASPVFTKGDSTVIASNIMNNLDNSCASNVSVKGSRSFTSSDTKTFSHTVSLKVETTVSFKFFGLGTEVVFGAEYGHSWSSETTQTEETVVEHEASMTVEPKTRSKVSIVVNATRAKLPFTAVIKYGSGRQKTISGLWEKTIFSDAHTQCEVLERRR